MPRRCATRCHFVGISSLLLRVRIAGSSRRRPEPEVTMLRACSLKNRECWMSHAPYRGENRLAPMRLIRQAPEIKPIVTSQLSLKGQFSTARNFWANEAACSSNDKDLLKIPTRREPVADCRIDTRNFRVITYHRWMRVSPYVTHCLQLFRKRGSPNFYPPLFPCRSIQPKTRCAFPSPRSFFLSKQWISNLIIIKKPRKKMQW